MCDDRPARHAIYKGSAYGRTLSVGRLRRRERRNRAKHKAELLFAGDVFSGHRGKFLQLELTIEDKGAFTTPWTSTLTYVPGPSTWPEVVCAENPHQYYYDSSDTDVPRADKPDF